MNETKPDETSPTDAGGPEPDGGRVLDFEVEVVGTREEVWEAIATGPGISSWFVPHTVDEEAGGTFTSRFGPGEDMIVPGRVAAWEPPHRVRFDGGDVDEGLAFEWTVEAASGGTCTVRLVNSGFGSGEDWDAMYDGMRDGWPMFLLNLQLHGRHFGGQRGSAMVPTGSWSGSREEAWASLLDAMGLPANVSVGDRIDVGSNGAAGAGADAAAGEGRPPLAGTVVDVAPHRCALLLDGPAPGTAFLAAERGHSPGSAEVSVWAYLYGQDRDELVARDEPRWAAWLRDRG